MKLCTAILLVLTASFAIVQARPANEPLGNDADSPSAEANPRIGKILIVDPEASSTEQPSKPSTHKSSAAIKKSSGGKVSNSKHGNSTHPHTTGKSTPKHQTHHVVPTTTPIPVSTETAETAVNIGVEISSTESSSSSSEGPSSTDSSSSSTDESSTATTPESSSSEASSSLVTEVATVAPNESEIPTASNQPSSSSSESPFSTTENGDDDDDDDETTAPNVQDDASDNGQPGPNKNQRGQVPLVILKIFASKIEPISPGKYQVTRYITLEKLSSNPAVEGETALAIESDAAGAATSVAPLAVAAKGGEESSITTTPTGDASLSSTASSPSAENSSDATNTPSTESANDNGSIATTGVTVVVNAEEVTAATEATTAASK